jgi:25S rRNA (uracil2634-N3)-methyltransferase
MGKSSKSLKAALQGHNARVQSKKAAEKALELQKVKGQAKKKHKANAKLSSASAEASTSRSVSSKFTNPFSPTDSILLVGEGNFSYTLALLRSGSSGKNITATAYDSEEDCYNKYPDAQEIVKEVREKGVEVLWSIDATKLKMKGKEKQRWDKVVWNFPHAGA